MLQGIATSHQFSNREIIVVNTRQNVGRRLQKP